MATVCIGAKPSKQTAAKVRLYSTVRTTAPMRADIHPLKFGGQLPAAMAEAGPITAGGGVSHARRHFDHPQAGSQRIDVQADFQPEAFNVVAGSPQGTYVGNVTASDNNGAAVLSYQITGGNACLVIIRRDFVGGKHLDQHAVIALVGVE